MCHGHNHPKIVAAIREQAAKLSQVMFAGFTHEPAIRLAQLLVESAPAGLTRVFYADSGSVAVECAAKMALQYQLAAGRGSRRLLGTVRGGYHGDTAGAMALSDPDGMHHMFSGILSKHHFAPQPATPFGADWNPDDFAPMEAMLDRYENEIAAVILEPVFQGASAMRFYHPRYLAELRRACSERDILLIFDEVATGFGRLGEFFAAEYAKVSPDLMCVGKGLTGGAIGLAALLASDKVAETISAVPPGKFMHGPTFMGNPLACSIACASLDLLSENSPLPRIGEIEGILRRELAPAAALPQVADVRTLGAIGVIELHRSVDMATLQQRFVDEGVWVRPFGRLVYVMPPYIIKDQELETLARAMVRVVAETE